MIHDPVEDFVRRALGLMRISEQTDQDRLAIRPGAPAAPTAELPLPKRAPVTAPELELIEAEAARTAHTAETPVVAPASGPVPIPASVVADGTQLALGGTVALDAIVAQPAATAFPLPPSGGTKAIDLVRLARHDDMDQRQITLAQTNGLDDRDVIGVGADAGMAVGLERFAELLSNARIVLANAAAGTGPAVIGESHEAGLLGIGDTPVAPGGNQMLNAAVVVETGMEIGVLAVLGDAHLSTTLMQLNILDDGGTRVGSVQNLAQRVELPSIPVWSAPTAGPVSLDLSVIEGHFLDILQVTQTQVFDDRDVIAWSETAEHLRIASGGNLGGNAAAYDLTDWGAELVIVEGDYVAMREIVQVNVADDADLAGSAPETAEAAAAGGTRMSNSAVLATPAGTETLGAMPDDIAALVATILAGETPGEDTLDRLDADGDGHVEALLVRGDYIDIKSIRQVNLLADADLMLGVPFASDTTPQTAAPANRLSNEAVILDATAGARDSYLAGERYDQTFLLDANLLGDMTRAPGSTAPDAAGATGGGFDLPPAALADAILFDAPTWGT